MKNQEQKFGKKMQQSNILNKSQSGIDNKYLQNKNIKNLVYQDNEQQGFE